VKLILHQRYRNRINGQIVTLLDISGEQAVVRHIGGIGRIWLYNLELFFDLLHDEAAA